MPPPRIHALLIALFSASCGFADRPMPDFEREIAPLLTRRCVECHRGAEPAGGLTLTSRQGLLAGGESGVVVDRDSPDESYLLRRIMDGEMPPEHQGRSQQLPDAEILLLKQWLLSGATWPTSRQLDFFERTNEVRAGRDWWSLQPVERPEVPQLANHQPSSPIDAFIRHRLADAGLQPAPLAPPTTRLRRLYYTLVGLPPTQDELADFVADPSAEAWEQAIDRLLDSPQYGVRWTRHWLDLARYADTSGYERDQEKPFAWKYRDWVVNALNNDMPYDQFIVHQLAGDEIESPDKQSTIATGFLRLGTWNDEPNDPNDYVYDRLEDMVHTTSSVFLAMTVKCARCHAHKFDAITQEDYYRVAAAFWAGPIKAGDRQQLGGPAADLLGFEDVLGWTDVDSTPTPLHLLHNGKRQQPRQAIVPATLSFLPHSEHPLDPPPPNAKTTTRRRQLARWIASPDNPLTPRVLVNRLWQHHFGQAIVRSPNNFGFLADPPTHPDLLDWLAADFIRGGWRIKRMHKLILLSETWQQASVHPNEADYAVKDSSNRLWWRAERRRVDAETLRDAMLASTGELDLQLGGPGFRPTISSEALEGLSRKSAAWTPSAAAEQLRRSLYMFAKRGLLPPFMTTFDMCDTTQSCGQRDSTTVPTQALTLLNNRFVYQRSERLAGDVVQQHDRLNDRINAVWSQILRRDPTPSERSLAVAHVQKQQATIKQEQAKQSPESHSIPDENLPATPHPPAEVAALASLAHVLLNSNEFLYID